MKKSAITILMLCIFLFPYCSKKTPTSPDIPEIILPTIEYFTANPESIEFKSDDIITLSWSTKNATNVIIDQGIGTVDKIGAVGVSPEETTTYTLTAINGDGQKTKSLTVEITARAIFELTYYEFGFKNYGNCCIQGIVENIGNAIGYNVMIEFQAYIGEIIVDTASGFPADLGNIPVGISAVFEAIFFELYSWDPITKTTYEITWLSEQGMKLTQTGIVPYK